MTKSKIAQFNKHKQNNHNIKNNNKKSNQELDKKEKWYVKFFKSFIAIIVTILIYTLVIKFLTQYSMVITQSVIREKGLESDPVLLLVFSVGLYSTIMAVFIAKVNVATPTPFRFSLYSGSFVNLPTKITLFIIL